MLMEWRVRELATSFHVKDAEAKELLETIGRTFLSSFACAAREVSVSRMG